MIDSLFIYTVDMLGYAMDNPAPTTIVLISGDRDFAYALSFLRLRRYRVILLTLPNAHISLTAQATVCLDWAVNDGLNASNTVEPAAATVQNKSSLLYAGNQNFPSADTQYTAQTAHIRQSANTENPFLIEQSMKVPRKDSIGKVPGNGFSLSPSVELSAAPRPSSANTSSGGSSKYLTPSVAPESYSSLTLSHTSTVSQSQGGFGHRVTSSTASDASEVTTNPSETSYPKESTGSSLLNTCNQQATIVVPTNNAAPLTAVNVVSHTIPKIFVVLVLYLQKLRGQGQYKPLRSQVAIVIAKGGETYRLAGVQKFSQYIAEAQKAGIVIVGGSEGTAWIALSPSWYLARDA